MSYISLLKSVLLDRIHNDSEARLDGKDWPLGGFSMIGQARMDNLQTCVEHVIARGVPGDLLEAGVWRGGSTILMRALLKHHGVTDRTVWVADSFEGLPKPKDDWPQDAGDTHHLHPELAVSIDDVQRNFERFGLMDDQVKFIKGWFHESLPTAPIGALAVLRLDGDMYESTFVSLTALYDKVIDGGFVIVDDYGYINSCKQAVHDFLDSRGLRPAILTVDWTGVYWVKGG